LPQMLLEAAERHARLHEPLQHADVVARPDVAGPAEDDRAGQPVAAEEELAVRRPVGPEARRRVRSVVVPGAEGGDVEVADLDDGDDEAPAVANVLAGPVRAHDAPVT